MPGFSRSTFFLPIAVLDPLSPMVRPLAGAAAPPPTGDMVANVAGEVAAAAADAALDAEEAADGDGGGDGDGNGYGNGDGGRRNGCGGGVTAPPPPLTLAK